ncbi:glycoside hydrolase family protein [Candidatus Pantoea persica]|uniref:glycoside hydrolase family protein n=1 Tax=Candidatus Pantoea persica TaxID=2518128 RepID=UPI00215DA3E2|nr:glycoside hydrolase family protein [Candidatus Pantoea persica]MBA2815480.1 hypothetical protein [Candidatus Pantoea persica]
MWKKCIIEGKAQQMQSRPLVQQALAKCNDARSDVLDSMAYQLGVDGLLLFKNMLTAVAAEDYDRTANAMLNSLWARQTTGRARRHAEVMHSSNDDVYRGLL